MTRAAAYMWEEAAGSTNSIQTPGKSGISRPRTDCRAVCSAPHSGIVAAALWFGTTGGLGRLAVVQETAHAPPSVMVTGLRVSAVPQPVSALGERHRSLPDLALRENQLEIDFVGLGFEPGDVLRYQHMLKGSGVGWSAPGNSGRLRTRASARGTTSSSSAR